MRGLDEERQSLEIALAKISAERPKTQLHPRAAENYAQIVEQLQATLGEATNADSRAHRDLVDAVRALVEKIVITPLTQDRGGPIDIVLHGTLAHFMTSNDQSENFGLGLVAGGGIEPPTCGL